MITESLTSDWYAWHLTLFALAISEAVVAASLDELYMMATLDVVSS